MLILPTRTQGSGFRTFGAVRAQGLGFLVFCSLRSRMLGEFGSGVGHSETSRSLNYEALIWAFSIG